MKSYVRHRNKKLLKKTCTCFTLVRFGGYVRLKTQTPRATEPEVTDENQPPGEKPLPLFVLLHKTKNVECTPP